MTRLRLLVCASFNITLLLGSLHGQTSAPEEPEALRITTSTIALVDVPVTLTVTALNRDEQVQRDFTGKVALEGVRIRTDGGAIEGLNELELKNGEATVTQVVFQETGQQEIQASRAGLDTIAEIRAIPGILSLLPPLFAIAIAFIARQVLISLFCGIWLGAIFIFDYNILTGFLRSVDKYLVGALADADHAAILIFSLTLGGMVGIISRAGGTQGIVDKLTTFANHARGGQLSTWAMGLLIFFDDYANTLIVGNTMRPFTDRLRISREKLSYIVDSTAAPVASVAIISTWIGFQLGLIDQAFEALALPHQAYAIFIQSIPYSTYSLLALFFVALVGFTQRDFGPMLDAEVRSRRSGNVLSDSAQPIADGASLDMVAPEGTPTRWYNALIPIVTVIVVTLIGLYYNGLEAMGDDSETSLREIFGAANSFHVLMWASFTSVVVAAALALGQRILTLHQTIEVMVNGYKSMMLAAMILLLAWAIGDICGDLRTADYVIELSKGILSPHLIPLVTFIIAAVISFSTGASWATMAILTPIVIPIAYKLPASASLDPALSSQILIATVGAVLSGSVLGDHCSPISDTTILSSMATAADHMDHVKTQIPYALLTGVVAMAIGYLPAGWGLNPFVSLGLGAIVLTGYLLYFGKPTEEIAAETEAKKSGKESISMPEA